MAEARVHVVIAAFRRPELLRRMLASLAGQDGRLAGVLVVNNGGDDETTAVAKTAPVPATVLCPGENLGTGGGLGFGLRHLLGASEATHFWIMDDDACATPGALAAMLEAQAATGAAAVSPLVPDKRGVVTWFPGPLAQPAWDIIRSGVTAEEFQARCGPTPLRWNWATWASLLVARSAVEAVGLPRTDFWYQSTDIEYTLRLSARFPCLLAPAAVCPHLPPDETPAQRRMKDLWSLQNNAFLTFRLPHGRRILRHLPGNHYRFWRNHRHEGGALRDSCSAFWRGALLGLTVGADDYYAFARKKG